MKFFTTILFVGAFTLSCLDALSNSSRPASLPLSLSNDTGRFLPNAVAVVAQRNRDIDPAGIKDVADGVVKFFKDGFKKFFGRDIPTFFNNTLPDSLNHHFIDRVIELFDPVLKIAVNKTLIQVTKTVGKLVNDTFHEELDKVIQRDWPGESIWFIKQNIYQPLKDKAKEVVEVFLVSIIKLMEEIIGNTKGFIKDDLKKAMKRYFGVGAERKHNPIAVKITHEGPFGFIQRKLEQLHADILHELQPSLVNYVVSLKPRLMDFIRDTLGGILSAALGSVSSTAIGRAIVNWLADQFKNLFASKVESSLATYSLVAGAELNKGLRSAFYGIFGFLKADLEKINADIKP